MRVTDLFLAFPILASFDNPRLPQGAVHLVLLVDTEAGVGPEG